MTTLSNAVPSPDEDPRLSPATQVNHRHMCDAFGHFADTIGQPAFPATAETTAAFLADLAEEGLSYSTINMYLHAIDTRHTSLNLPRPGDDSGVRTLMAGIRRAHQAPRRSHPLSTVDLTRMVATVDPTTPVGARDVALTLTGIYGNLRSTELVRLRWTDVVDGGDHIQLHLRHAKNSSRDRGAIVTLSSNPSCPDLCPVAALRRLSTFIAQPTETPLFPHFRQGSPSSTQLTSTDARRIVTRMAAGAHLATGITPHSLRCGCMADIARTGASLAGITRFTRHSSLGICLRHYLP